MREEHCDNGCRNFFFQCLPLNFLRSLFLSLFVCRQYALGCVCLCVLIGNLTIIVALEVVNDLTPLWSCWCCMMLLCDCCCKWCASQVSHVTRWNVMSHGQGASHTPIYLLPLTSTFAFLETFFLVIFILFATCAQFMISTFHSIMSYNGFLFMTVV